MSTKASLELKARLDAEMQRRNRSDEISYERPDPILVAHRHRDEWVSLVCALFAYGRADAIVGFLDTLDFALLDSDEVTIRATLQEHYYRFQSSEDIVEFFISLHRLKQHSSLESLFMKGYSDADEVLSGVNSIITAIYDINQYDSRGYRFLTGKVVKKRKGASALKRWMMFLRWMVRDDAIDMGLWKQVSASKLIIPLDTHTFSVSKRLGLLQRKSYDLQAACELTEALKKFDPLDPVKYDFALYRLGQERLA